MATSYPAALDNWGVFDGGKSLGDPTQKHALVTTDMADAIQAIQVELGTDPSGTFVTVKDRVVDLETNKIATSARGAANGVASLDASTLVPVAQVPNLDAAKIASGILAVARIPDLDTAKITTGIFGVPQIPDLDAVKVASGTFAVARIPDLDAAKVTTGIFDIARIPSRTKVKTADEVVNNSITLQNDDHLVLAVEANTRYAWRAFIKWAATTVADWKMDLSLPSGAGHDSVAQTWNRDGAAPDYRMLSTGASVGIPGWGVTWSTQGRLTEVHGHITIGGTAGNAQIRWAQNTAEVSDATVMQGSWLELVKL